MKRFVYLLAFIFAMSGALSIPFNTTIYDSTCNFAPKVGDGYGRTQVFQAPNATHNYLKAVHVYVQGKTGTPSTFQLRVVATNGTTQASTPDWDNILYPWANVNISQGSITGGAFNTFTFSQPVPLNTSTYYAVAMYSGDPAGTYYTMCTSNTNQYANGHSGYATNADIGSPNLWSMAAGEDYRMKIELDEAPGPTQVNFTAYDVGTASAITTFNATINGTNYTTTNGTIVTAIYNGSTVNATGYANGYYDLTFTNLVLTATTQMNFTQKPRVNITAKNSVTNASINTFTATIDGYQYNTTNGTIVTTVINGTSVNVSVAASLYQTYSVNGYVLVANTQFNLTPVSDANMTAKNNDTLAAITTFNATINGTLYTTTNGTIQTAITGGSIVNMTVRSVGYIDTVYTDVPFVVGFVANLSPIRYFAVYVRDEGGNLLTRDATVTANGSQYQTSTGSVTTNILGNYNAVINVSATSAYYIGASVTDYTASYNVTLNVTSRNATQTATIANVDMTDYDTHTEDLDGYFDYAESYEIEVLSSTTDINGTGTRLGNSTGVYGVQNAYYNVTLSGSDVIIRSFDIDRNASIRVFTYDVDGEERSAQRFDFRITVESTNDVLGFDLDVSDAMFWLFIVLGIAFVVGTFMARGLFIGYVGGMYFLYYGVSFFMTGAPLLFPITFLSLAVLLVWIELGSN